MKTKSKKAMTKTRREKRSGTLVRRGRYWTARVCHHGRIYTKSLRTGPS